MSLSLRANKILSLCAFHKCLRRTYVGTITARLHQLSTVASTMEDDSCASQLFDQLEIFRWLENETPCFPVDGNKVHVIYEPDVFYSTLLKRARAAQKRITIASLYLGTGKLEKDLVASLEYALESNQFARPRVRVLLDAARGSRGVTNSRTMLLPLVKSYGDHCSVHLYHTPALRGIMKRIMPERWNELIGLQHMKVYLFDDSLLISGANLSHDYFTNRQDRYMLFDDCKNLADFVDSLIETVSHFSFQMDAGNNLHLDPDCNHHPYEEAGEQFAAEAKKKVYKLFEDQLNYNRNKYQWPNSNNHDTWVFPLVQMGQLGIYMDNIMTRRILESVPHNAELSLATGYFNLTQDYMDSILHSSQPKVNILLAHPSANGFLGAQGFAGGVPSAYTLLASQFYEQTVRGAQSMRIRLWEYQRQLWTFHAKGMWVSFNNPEDPKPCFTLIGSPNFGYRSVHRDLETQLAVVTVNTNLRDQLHEERKNLFLSAETVDSATYSNSERSVPLWVKFVIRVFKHFF